MASIESPAICKKRTCLLLELAGECIDNQLLFLRLSKSHATVGAVVISFGFHSAALSTLALRLSKLFKLFHFHLELLSSAGRMLMKELHEGLADNGQIVHLLCQLVDIAFRSLKSMASTTNWAGLLRRLNGLIHEVSSIQTTCQLPG